MKLKQKFKVFVLLFILFFNNSLATENKILVKVNNKIITSVDILNEIKFLSFGNKEFINIEKNQQIEIAKNSLIKQYQELFKLEGVKLTFKDQAVKDIANKLSRTKNKKKKKKKKITKYNLKHFN